MDRDAGGREVGVDVPDSDTAVLGGSVLVVDDNPDNLRVNHAILAGAGLRVRVASGGEAALRSAESSPPDVVLLDICMPGMDGFEVCRRLKSSAQLHDIPVIFLSALGETGDKLRAFEAGGADYVTKPFPAEELLARVRSQLARKRAEEALRESHAQLQEAHRRLKEAGTQLAQAEKMAAVGQLAAGVAHEINNPIGYISCNISSLRGYLAELFRLIDAYQAVEGELSDASQDAVARLKQELDLPFLRQDATKLIDETREGVERVKRIVLDLKDFSHAENEEQWRLAQLHEGLESTLNIVWHELKYKAEVRKAFGDLPLVECLPSKLNQVFMNLLVNAAQAIEGHGYITIRTGGDEEEVWVAVEDTGQGIAPEHLARLFDPFFTTKPVGQGTGLGLSLAYEIVARHGGRIDVASTPGEGSTFTVRLPARQRRPQ